MSTTPYHLTISAARTSALFASPLQPSDEPSTRQVRHAIATAISAHGVRGCAARVPHAYGEHPETALIRMCWALTAVASAFGGSPVESAHAPAHRCGSGIARDCRAGTFGSAGREAFAVWLPIAL